LLNFSVAGLDGERAVFALDERGVAMATGSACAASKDSRSHVLAAIGLSEAEIDGSLRISLGRLTTEAEIEQVKPILRDVIKEQLRFGGKSA
jgi:cysteine desulfurase